MFREGDRFLLVSQVETAFKFMPCRRLMILRGIQAEETNKPEIISVFEFKSIMLTVKLVAFSDPGLFVVLMHFCFTVTLLVQ